jgi:hypothetical protein
MENKCSPGRILHKNSCFSKIELMQINNLVPNLKNKSLSDEELIHILQNKCKKSNTKTCNAIKENINYILKPKLKKYGIWLNTNDINSIMKGYTKYDNSFGFLGTFPSDFCNFINLKKELQNYIADSKLGLVLNLDTSKGQGYHWVSVFIDINTKTVEYFNSLGKKPKETKKCIKKLIEELNKIYDTKFKFKYNTFVHQKGDSECGVYSVYFLISRLLGYSFEDITENIKNDQIMGKFRNFIFR